MPQLTLPSVIASSSALSIYRGHQPVPNYDFILGHEFVGEVHEVGGDIKNFKVGDGVVCPFTISW